MVLNNKHRDMSINQRIKDVVDRMCEGNVSEFARIVGVKQPVIRDVVGTKQSKPGFDTLSRIVDNSTLNVDADWLLTGRGEMLRNVTITKHHNPKYNEKLRDYEVVPLYSIEAAAGLSTIFENGVEYIDGYITLPNMSAVDGAVAVRGDSMYPLLKAGDVVVYKKVSGPEYIIYGQMYLIEYSWDDDSYVVVKYINRSEKEGYIRLVSYNEYHDPMDIPLANIMALGLVKVSIRYNTIK